MSGYREDNFDLGEGQTRAGPRKGGWKWFFGMILYMIPLFWLLRLTGFPESFGIERCHGRGCWVEDWFHSYLLAERHSPLDCITFVYMWAPVVALIAWFFAPRMRRLRGTKLSIYADDDEERAR